MHEDLINIVALGFGFAFIFGFIAHKLKLSPIVGYLVAGFIVGPHSPGFQGNLALADQLANIGVILLMFGVGLHFSIKDLNTVKWTAIPGALLQITCASSLGFILGYFVIGWGFLPALVFGLSLSMASTVVVMRALEEHRLIDSKRGKIILGWLIVEDLFSVLLLVLLPIIATLSSHSADSSLSAGEIIYNISFTFLKLGLFVAFMLIVGKRVVPWGLKQAAGTGSREIFTLTILAISMGVALGASAIFGVSFALGAFFAGMILNESEFSHQAANDTLPLRDAFAVLFFVSVGMLFNPSIIIEQPLGVLGTTLIIILGKAGGAYLIVRMMGHLKVKALTVAASLAQIGEFSFIIAKFGVKEHMLTQSGQDLILAGALISIIVNPFIFAYLAHWEKKQASNDNTAAVELDIPTGPNFVHQDHTIIIGYGGVGKELARSFQNSNIPFVVIDDNEEHVLDAHKNGVPAIRGNAAMDAVLEESYPQFAKLAIVAIPHAFETASILEKLKILNPDIHLYARAQTDSEIDFLKEHGADGVVSVGKEVGHSLASLIAQNHIYEEMKDPHQEPVVNLADDATEDLYPEHTPTTASS